MAGSRMVRVHDEFDIYLERLSMELSQQMGRHVSKTEASQMLACRQQLGGGIVVLRKKRKGDEDIFSGSLIRL